MADEILIQKVKHIKCDCCGEYRRIENCIEIIDNDGIRHECYKCYSKRGK